jgi:uncharacterized alpha-E superfamily protein
MLSRVAESLYWTARYVERAELVSRIVHVNFHSLLDADPAGRDQAWRRLLQLVGTDEIYREHFDEYSRVRQRVPALGAAEPERRDLVHLPRRARTRGASATRSRPRCGRS